ncbi:MAG TPA: argininosuccinate lyase, partial [bacterium]|nr:argininosuccinate lyase [bacterium]
LADVLVKVGVPFRLAHEVVGRVVHYCLEKGKRLQDLTDAELDKFSDLFPKGTAQHLSVLHSVNAKQTVGGTSPKNVEKQVKTLNKEIGSIRKRLTKL